MWETSNYRTSNCGGSKNTFRNTSHFKQRYGNPVIRQLISSNHRHPTMSMAATQMQPKHLNKAMLKTFWFDINNFNWHFLLKTTTNNAYDINDVILEHSCNVKSRFNTDKRSYEILMFGVAWKTVLACLKMCLNYCLIYTNWIINTIKHLFES